MSDSLPGTSVWILLCIFLFSEVRSDAIIPKMCWQLSNSLQHHKCMEVPLWRYIEASFSSTFFKEFHKSLAFAVKSLLKHEHTSQALFLNHRRGNTLDNFLQKLQETGLHYEVVENYDSRAWKRHMEIQNGNKKYWDNYDKNHCYPVLI